MNACCPGEKRGALVAGRPLLAPVPGAEEVS